MINLGPFFRSKDFYRHYDLWYILTMKNFMRFLVIVGLWSLTHLPVSAIERNGADYAAPFVASFMKSLPITNDSMYVFTAQNTTDIIELAASLKINVFELIDCTYRYLDTVHGRVSINGLDLRNQEILFNLGGERVLAILPISKLRYLELGSILNPRQKPLDLYLDSVHQTYIEIGTAVYETHCGFSRLKPLAYEQAFGITVKKMIFNAPLDRLDLYAPGKGAIYVKGLSRPKKWNLDIIKAKAQ